MTQETARPQDIGRKHRRSRTGGGANAALVERYQAAMRDELTSLLTELAPVPQDQGLGMVKVPDKRPDLSTRSKIWDLAIKLGRELGAAIDPDPLTDIDAPRRPVRRRQPDYG